MINKFISLAVGLLFLGILFIRTLNQGIPLISSTPGAYALFVGPVTNSLLEIGAVNRPGFNSCLLAFFMKHNGQTKISK